MCKYQKKILKIILLFFITLSISACGQKGPLYLPKQKENSHKTMN
ncbi:LPS translocon maturation chaperone LptM [Candidatus Nitrosacidococcus tergens]|nr:lipoprotein [Candidatus Nitrosacidococcus tergens]